MNENSSRFAKYLDLSFRNDGQVIGGKEQNLKEKMAIFVCQNPDWFFRCPCLLASISDYMLEKCRVVARNEDCHEGNFHIFYGMFAGMSTQEKQELYLMKPEAYG